MSTLKRLNCAAKSTWCPSKRYSSLVACAASTDIIGDDYVARSTLSVYDIALEDRLSSDMRLLGSASVKGSITCLDWGIKGIDDAALMAPKGILATGLDNNVFNLWNADAIANGQGEGAILASTETASPLTVLAFHPMEQKVFATGSRDGELLIWDVSRLDQPRSARAPQQTRGGVTCFAWNRRVQQLFATASEQGETSIWDMRQKNPVRTVMPSNRISLRPNALSWDDEVHFATSHYGSAAVEIWDLRRPNGCVTRIHHPPAAQAQPTGYGIQQQNSVIHSAFCPQDRNIFSTVSDDGTTALWRADTGALVSITNLPECAELDWAPHEAGIVLCTSSASVTVASMTNMGSYVPAWAPRRAGVSFGFGGKLLAFGQDATPPSAPTSPIASPTSATNPQWTALPRVQQPSVLVHTLPADAKAQADAMAFYNVAAQNNYIPFTQAKASEASSEAVHDQVGSPTSQQDDQETPITAEAKQWKLISLLYSTPRSELGRVLLEELKFKGADESSLESLSNPGAAIDNALKEVEDEYNNTVAAAQSRAASERARINTELQSAIASIENSVTGTSHGEFDLDAMLSGGGGGSGDLFSLLSSGSGEAGSSDGSSQDAAADAEATKQKAIDEANARARAELAAVEKTLNNQLNSAQAELKKKQSDLKQQSDAAASDIAQGIRSGALVATPPVNVRADGPIRDAVIADALLLAACAGEHVWSQIRAQYLAAHRQPFFATALPYILQGDYNSLVANSKLQDWRQTLASLISTYFDPQYDNFAALATALGDRLAAAAGALKAGASPAAVGVSSELAAAIAAFYCYIAATNADKIIQLWTGFPSLTQAALNKKLRDEQRSGSDAISPSSYTNESKEDVSASPSSSSVTSLALSSVGQGNAGTALPLLLVEKATSLAVAFHQSSGSVPPSPALMRLYGDYIARLVSLGLQDLAYGFLSLAQMFSQSASPQAEDPLLVMRDLLVNSRPDAEAVKQDLVQRKQPLRSPWNPIEVGQDPMWLQYQSHRQQQQMLQQQQFQQQAAAAAAAAASANVGGGYGAPAGAPAAPRYGQPTPVMMQNPAPTAASVQPGYYGAQANPTMPTASPNVSHASAGMYAPARQTATPVPPPTARAPVVPPTQTQPQIPTQPQPQPSVPMASYAPPTHALPHAPVGGHVGAPGHMSQPAVMHQAPTPVPSHTPAQSTTPVPAAGVQSMARPAPMSNPIPTSMPSQLTSPAQTPAQPAADPAQAIDQQQVQFIIQSIKRLNEAVDVAAANTQEARKSATRVKGLDQLYAKVGTPEISQRARNDLVSIISALQKGDHATALTYCASLNDQSGSQSFWFVCLKSLLVTARNLNISL